MRPPGNYDALRQAEQQAREAREGISKPEAAPQLDSAQEEPARPTKHPATFAKYGDDGAPTSRPAPAVPQMTRTDLAEIARAAKEREDAANQAKEQDKGRGGNGR